MNGELEKLQEKLQNLIEETRVIDNEILSIRAMKKAGKKLLRKDLRYLRDLEIKKEINNEKIEDIISQIETLGSTENAKKAEATIDKEEVEKFTNGNYSLSHENIPESTLNIGRVKTNNESTSNKENTTNKEEQNNSTYHLLGENILDSKYELDIFKSLKTKEQENATTNNTQSVEEEPEILDIELDDSEEGNLEKDNIDKEPIDNQNEDYEYTKENNTSKDRKSTALKATAAALLVGIGAASIKLYDEVKKTNKQSNTTMEQPITPDTDSNIAYDYAENVVTITPEQAMTANETLSNPFINVAGYNEAYLKDYEDAMNRYNILAEKAIDYVNRTHIIQDNYHFFAETSINEVLKVIMAIDQREIMTDENNNVADAMNNSLNSVLDGVLWKGLTDADIAKLDAIPYFAEEGTDLNIHLKEYARLAKDAIVNQTEEAFNNMYQYLQIFTLSQFDNTLAVNIIEPDGSITERPVNESTVEVVGTVTREFYDAATVNNVYDWWMAYNSFIKPLYSTYFPYDYYDERVRRWEDLQCIMQSGMEDPKFDEVCGNSLTRGGE